jgi:hypothetical protein
MVSKKSQALIANTDNQMKHNDRTRIAIVTESLRPYLEALLERVEKNSLPKIELENKFPIVAFHVDKAGYYSKLRMAQSSGAAQIDKLAIDSVKQVVRFDPLPDQFESGIDVAIRYYKSGVCLKCNN